MEDFELFKGKTLSNLFEDIYINQVNKKVKISQYVDEIKAYVRHAGDIAVIAFWDGKSRGTHHSFTLCEQLKKPLKIIRY